MSRCFSTTGPLFLWKCHWRPHYTESAWAKISDQPDRLKLKWLSSSWHRKGKPNMEIRLGLFASSIYECEGPPPRFHFRSWEVLLHMWITDCTKPCLAPKGAVRRVMQVLSVNWDGRLNQVSFPHTPQHLMWKQKIPFSSCITPESVSPTWGTLWRCNNDFAED